MTNPDEQGAATDPAGFLVCKDEALSAFAAIDGPTSSGGLVDLLREIITRGRDARVLLEPTMPPIRQYASLAELAAAAGGIQPALEEDPVAKALGIVRCCDGHGVTCEPPSELCCRYCPERNHPDHPNVDCVLHTDADRDAVMRQIVKEAGDNGIMAGAIMARMIRLGRAWARRSDLFPALKRAIDEGLIVQPLERGRYHWRASMPAAGGDQ